MFLCNGGYMNLASQYLLCTKNITMLNYEHVSTARVGFKNSESQISHEIIFRVSGKRLVSISCDRSVRKLIETFSSSHIYFQTSPQ